jgi:thioesterase domain-containing protein
MKAAFNLSRSDRVIHKASASFDASIAEIFAPLAAGAQVIVAGPEAHRDIDSLIRTIRDRGVTFIDLPPTLLRALLEHPEIKQCTSLRHVVSGGEALAADLQAQATTLLSAQLYNTYGPTETTVQSTFWVCSPEPHTRSAPIGRPIANTRVYVLDSNGEPTPIGVDGELCIGGAGLTRGYLNRPALTAEKFVPDPFSSEAGDRLYKAGDRVRWRRDGALEFLGRTDNQVKIRGFRIEPGEIESTMLAHPQVREVAVVVQDDSASGKKIVAFVALEKDSQTQVQELRQYAKDFLPFYMRPNHYLLMERLPLNANGKIDRNSLGRIQLPDETRKDIVPRTATEKILCRIWADILKREEVGVEDDFFALGGHSLLAVNLVSQIARFLGRDVALDKIFEHSTPRQMARWISDKNGDHERSALVCMNKGLDQSRPLYLTYPIGGNVLCYSDLARFINRDKPFYALQALPGDELQHSALEEIAASCLRSIQQRHHGGGYELGGWSFGGMLAFEMARQATAAGDPPATLYLIDPPVLEDLPQDDQPDEEMAGLFLLTLIADFSGGKSIDLEKLRKNFDPKNSSLEVYLQKAVELGLLPAGTDPSLHTQSFKIFKRNIRATHFYRPRKYSGKTLLVLREMGHSETWSRLLPENTSIIRVPGNHFTMLRGSNAATIARLLE